MAQASEKKRSTESKRILIIGAGMSGICLAIQLRRAGIESFKILERSDDVGGTWRDNVYPGAACDIPSFLYSFSFAPKYNWRRKYARQPEIQQYFRECADRFDIIKHVRFGSVVERADFDEKEMVWRVQTADGQVLTAEILVSAVGQLSQPNIPDLNGLNSFVGTSFHSARWNHDCDLDGRTVAVIGNAASAVQFLPHVVARARKTSVFQRTPNWISRLPDYAYSRLTHWAMRNVPGIARAYRWGILLSNEWRGILLMKSSFQNACLASWLRWRMRKAVSPENRTKLIPNYAPGCKRILLSNEYLKLVQQDNVELITSPIEQINKDSVVTEEGPRQVDVIIFATGFKTLRFLHPIEIRGLDGILLREAWAPRPRTYLGLMSPGFPNFFTLYGPNTNLGLNSIIFMVECQVNFVIRCIRRMMHDGDQTIEVKEEVVDEFDRRLQKSLARTVWSGDDCSSWYKSSDGFITNNWGSSVFTYWYRTRKPDFRQFKRDSNTSSCDQ